MNNRELLIKALQENDIQTFNDLVDEKKEYCPRGRCENAQLTCDDCEAEWFDLEYEDFSKEE